jgi:hypothetical protein
MLLLVLGCIQQGFAARVAESLTTGHMNGLATTNNRLQLHRHILRAFEAFYMMKMVRGNAEKAELL